MERRGSIVDSKSLFMAPNVGRPKSLLFIFVCPPVETAVNVPCEFNKRLFFRIILSKKFNYLADFCIR